MSATGPDDTHGATAAADPLDPPVDHAPATRRPSYLLPPLAAETDDLAALHPHLEPPDPSTGRASLTVERSFAFVDICGFTTYCEHYGEHLALELLIEFRQITRAVVARRGVRVSKWLGDGVMIVSLEPALLAAACVEIGLRCTMSGLDTHAGIATGSVLLLEGDDYVGRTVNLAARLCDAAELGQILAAGALPGLPSWLHVAETVPIDLAGVDEPVHAHALAVDEIIRSAFEATSDVA